MSLFTIANWPVLFIIAAMIVAAVIDAWKFKVPNTLTFPLVLSGWFLGLLYDLGLVTEAHGSRSHVVASLAGTILGFALLLPIYRIGGMGAGDVKMTMGFGAWIGAFYGFWKGMTIVLYGFCAATIIGGILALVMIFLRRQFQRNIQNTREIVGDLLKAPGLDVINQKAQERKSRLDLLPYGVPLCLGFVGYLFFWQA